MSRPTRFEDLRGAELAEWYSAEDLIDPNRAMREHDAEYERRREEYEAQSEFWDAMISKYGLPRGALPPVDDEDCPF